MAELTNITATLHALVKAMADAHSSSSREEAHKVARAIFAAIRDGKVPLLRLDDE